MGEVYRARDTVLERDVALKLLLPRSRWAPGPVPRLLREAQSAARLSHPNICTVHEVGSFEGRPFLAMEYVEGQTLAQTLKEGALPSIVFSITASRSRGRWLTRTSARFFTRT